MHARQLHPIESGLETSAASGLVGDDLSRQLDCRVAGPTPDRVVRCSRSTKVLPQEPKRGDVHQ
jgi:hypothetical protein